MEEASATAPQIDGASSPAGIDTAPIPAAETTLEPGAETAACEAVPATMEEVSAADHPIDRTSSPTFTVADADTDTTLIPAADTTLAPAAETTALSCEEIPAVEEASAADGASSPILTLGDADTDTAAETALTPAAEMSACSCESMPEMEEASVTVVRASSPTLTPVDAEAGAPVPATDTTLAPTPEMTTCLCEEMPAMEEASATDHPIDRASSPTLTSGDVGSDTVPVPAIPMPADAAPIPAAVETTPMAAAKTTPVAAAETIPTTAVETTQMGAACTPTPPSSTTHMAPRHMRSSSFHRWRRQMQRAWKWGPAGSSSSSYQENGFKATVNVEIMANQKRQWYRIQSKARDSKHYKEPTSLFEHFFIVGLHSYANVDVIEDAFAKRKSWESKVAKSEILDLRKLHYRGGIPSLEPQVLFKYPPGKSVAMRENDVPAFCFPEGVKARLIERTPSMSDLNEVVFGQEHQARDDLAFIFCLKVSDNATLYGVCLHVQEIVQRAPGILGAVSPLPHSSSKSSRFLVSAPRCYCLLTRVPFFELHYEMLNSIIAQERLNRITQFVSEMTLIESIQEVTEQDEMEEHFDSHEIQSSNNWMGYAIPVDSVSGLISPSTGLVSETDVPPCTVRPSEPQSPESVSASEASDVSHMRELEKETRKALQYDECSSDTTGSHSRSDSFEKMNGSFDNGHTSPDVCPMYFSQDRSLERVESMESVYSSVRGAGSDDEDDELNLRHEIVAGDEKVMGWAKAHNNEPLQIVCGYHALPLPSRGSEVVFHPLEHLQPVKYCRPGLSSLGFNTVENDSSCPSNANEIKISDKVNAQLEAAEEALALSIWTTATVCRSLSLESVLTLLAGALLEKQVVVICPNLGVLSAVVLSLIPMMRPFEWQSLLLPVLPGKMNDFLDAPVPFIVGVQRKPTDMKKKIANLICIKVYKNQVKACQLPQLPRYRELFSDLSPIHAKLSCEEPIASRHPVYRCSEAQAEAARQFLSIMKSYLESLCTNLRSHTITNVQSNNDKVSLLLKDSFIDSFPTRDRPFIKLFVDTQLFSVLSDSRLSSYENE